MLALGTEQANTLHGRTALKATQVMQAQAAPDVEVPPDTCCAVGLQAIS
jgi:hypothetical protein